MNEFGLEWIETIPDGWQKRRLKHVASLKSGDGITTEDIEAEGPYPVYGGNGLRGYSTAYTHDGDFVLIGRQGALCGNINFASGKFWASEHAVVATPVMKIATRWLGELLRIMNLNQYSISAAQPGLAIERINDLHLPVPPLPLQKAIASYLDKETARIDALISKKERQIELLQEKRQAIITRAVIKGLDPNAKTKDSGVGWIGEIPEHWKVRKLRFIGSCQNGISKGGEFFGTGFPFLSYGDVYKNPELPREVEGLVESTPQERLACSVEAGDVLFTRTSETVEEIGIASTCLETITDAVFAGFLIRVRPKNGLLAKAYSKYYFRSELMRRFFVKEMNLVTRASLGQDLLKNLPVLLPPFQEMQEIGDYLEDENRRIDLLVEKLVSSERLLHEYRSSLITAAVSGQIEIGIPN